MDIFDIFWNADISILSLSLFHFIMQFVLCWSKSHSIISHCRLIVTTTLNVSRWARDRRHASHGGSMASNTKNARKRWVLSIYIILYKLFPHQNVVERKKNSISISIYLPVDEWWSWDKRIRKKQSWSSNDGLGYCGKLNPFAANYQSYRIWTELIWVYKSIFILYSSHVSISVHIWVNKRAIHPNCVNIRQAHTFKCLYR